MKSRFLLVILATLLALSLAACNSPNSDDNSQASSTVPTSLEPSVAPSPEATPTKSIEELCSSYKDYILALFDTCDVSNDDHNIVITASSAGLASSLGSIKTTGDDSSWTTLKGNFSSKVEDWLREAEDAGYTDISITFSIQNDVATDEFLLKICNEKIIYDALDDDSATLTIQRVIPDPVTYTGSGDSVVTLDPFEGGFVFHIIGNQAGHHFAVKGYDSDGEYTELFVNTTSAYDGITIDPAQETSILEVNATGSWTIEVQSIFTMKTISSGETLTGSGDSVVLVSSHGNTATISGNADGHHFAVKSYGKEQDKLLVNTTDAYDGTVMLTGDPAIMEITATGAWSISFD